MQQNIISDVVGILDKCIFIFFREEKDISADIIEIWNNIVFLINIILITDRFICSMQIIIRFRDFNIALLLWFQLT